MIIICNTLVQTLLLLFSRLVVILIGIQVALKQEVYCLLNWSELLTPCCISFNFVLECISMGGANTQTLGVTFYVHVHVNMHIKSWEVIY